MKVSCLFQNKKYFINIIINIYNYWFIFKTRLISVRLIINIHMFVNIIYINNIINNYINN